MAKRAAKKSKTKSPARSPGKPSTRVRQALAQVEALHEQADLIHSHADALHKGAAATHKKATATRKAIQKRGARLLPGELPPRGKASERTSPAEKVHAEPLMPDPGAAPESVLPFTVVGIGASAGGFEAISQLLGGFHDAPDFSMVLLQHLDPTHESRLTQLLAQHSPLPIREIRHNMPLERGNIYVLPPNATVLLEQGRFRLGPREPRGCPMPVDFFFRSLANEQQHRAIGVVLSGTGTDGTLGLQEIKAEGGITFAQDKSSSKFFGMPGSAVAAGAVDFVLPPDAIARKLLQLVDHPYVGHPPSPGHRAAALIDVVPAEKFFEKHPEEMKRLFTILRGRSGVDFSLYKPGTLNRRIMRRMAMHKIEKLPQYVDRLKEDAGELDQLFHDLLISVTGFFRDPASFAIIKKRLLPKIIKSHADGSPIRIWTCGCATGEEAYSLAIVVAEFLEEVDRQLPIQIFASDLNERGIEKARTGLYHENILLDLSPERLRRFFVKVDSYYQVKKIIRDMCVFARQNVVSDPPFSNLDLISCRNVLIYLTPVLQRRIMPVFHYALKPGGFMLLGSSETMGESSEMFELVDKKNKIYIKKITAYRPTVDLQQTFMPAREITPPPPPPPAAPPSALRPGPPPGVPSIETSLQQRVDRLILNEFSPTAVVINAHMDVLQFRGKTGEFLEHQTGAASLNLIKMARDDLAIDIRRAVTKALQNNHRVDVSAQVSLGGHLRNVEIQVHPLPYAPTSERFFLVMFKDITNVREGEDAARDDAKTRTARKKLQVREVVRLREELAATKESLQAIIEEQDATNEELKSANEEIQSSNEELQSTNEELETAREELQSTNEELTTLNQELQNRNAELADVNNDLTNLLASVNIAIIMLGTDFKVRRFTPMAEKIFNLIPSDVGRRLSDLNRNIKVPDLDDAILDVIDTLRVVDREVQDHEGRWYSLRIRPYRTRESRIDGVVLILLDIDELKRAIKHIISLAREPLLALTADLKVTRANDAFCRVFGIAPENAEGKSVYEIADGAWNIPRLKQLIEEFLPAQGEVRDFRLEHDFKQLGKRTLIINARRFYEESRGLQLILLAIEDVT